MPCGGIEPAKADWEGLPKEQEKCKWCYRSKGDAAYVYFCKEGNCWVHKECVHKFLEMSSWGRTVFAHRHRIHILEEEDG